MSKGTLGGGAIFIAVMIAVTQYFSFLPGYLNYVWAFFVLVWGLKVLK